MEKPRKFELFGMKLILRGQIVPLFEIFRFNQMVACGELTNQIKLENRNGKGRLDYYIEETERLLGCLIELKDHIELKQKCENPCKYCYFRGESISCLSSLSCNESFTPIDFKAYNALIKSCGVSEKSLESIDNLLIKDALGLDMAKQYWMWKDDS